MATSSRTGGRGGVFAILGAVAGGVLGLLLVLGFGWQHPTTVIEVESGFRPEQRNEVLKDLDPNRLGPHTKATWETIYMSDPPLVQFSIRTPPEELSGWSNRVAQAYQRPVLVRMLPGTWGLPWTLEAWAWILGGALAGALVGAAGATAMGSGGRENGAGAGVPVLAVVGMALAGVAGVVALKYWPEPTVAVATLEKIEAVSGGGIRLVRSGEGPWRVWRAPGTDPGRRAMLTPEAIGERQFVDARPFPGRSLYWAGEGGMHPSVPTGQAKEAWVPVAPTELRLGWEPMGGIRVEWKHPPQGVPPDGAFRIRAQLVGGAEGEVAEAPGWTNAWMLTGAVASQTGAVQVAVATVSGTWGSSEPIIKSLPSRAQVHLDADPAGGIRILLPPEPDGYWIGRSRTTDALEARLVASDPVKAPAFRDPNPLPGRSYYWVQPARGRFTAGVVPALEAWAPSAPAGFGAKRDEEGAVHLEWAPAGSGQPPDAVFSVTVRVDGGEPIGLDGVGAGATRLLFDGGRTNGRMPLEFVAGWRSLRWGGAWVTSRVEAVPPPRVAKRPAAAAGRFDLTTAGIAGAVRLQWLRARSPQSQSTRFRFGSPDPDDELEAGAEAVGPPIPVGTTVVPVPVRGPRAQAHALVAMNAGGQTRVTEWVRYPRPSRESPFTNSLGQPYVPVSNVLFCVWETRVRDFREFAKATGFQTGTNMWSWDSTDFSADTTVWKQMGHTWEKPGFEQTEDHPVVGVSYEDAEKFCAWLTQRDRKAGVIGTNDVYRLPTDAEWSAAVGPTKYPWGNQWPPPNRVGNYGDKDRDGGYLGGKNGDRAWMTIDGYEDGYRRTAPVGSYPANALGLFDLGGNVWEAVADWYRAEMNSEEVKKEFTALANDGGGKAYRVFRGGSWFVVRPVSLESGLRDAGSPGGRNGNIGFRCVLELGVLR